MLSIILSPPFGRLIYLLTNLTRTSSLVLLWITTSATATGPVMSAFLIILSYSRSQPHLIYSRQRKLRNFKYHIACVTVGSRPDNVDSILTGIFPLTKSIVYDASKTLWLVQHQILPFFCSTALAPKYNSVFVTKWLLYYFAALHWRPIQQCTGYKVQGCTVGIAGIPRWMWIPHNCGDKGSGNTAGTVSNITVLPQ